jgi:hypothetical protein
LIISITPVSAVETAHVMDMNQTKAINNSLNSLNNDMDHLHAISDTVKIHIDKIKDDQDYIQSNWYKFWKWGKVSNSMEDINDQLEQIKAPTDELTVTSQRISNDLDDLNAINNSFNGSSGNEIYTGDSYSRAQYLALLLQAKNISVEISNPTNFKEGDIVQYHDEAKYYRYLKYNGIDNKTNFVKLQDRYREILVSQENFNQTATLKISSTDKKELLTPVNQVLVFELKKLNNTYEDKLNSSKVMDNSLSDISYLVKILLIGGGIGFVIVGLLSLVTSWKAIFIYTISVLIVITMMSTCALIITVLKDKMDSSANEILEERTNLYKCIYGEPHSYPVAENYNLTTSVNKKISGYVECTQYDFVFEHFVDYIVVKPPEHGNLNLSEHGLYVYTPNPNFTGTDSFKYKVNEGAVDSNVAEVRLNISKNSTHMTLWNDTMDNEYWLMATLTDDSGNPIPNKNIKFMFNGTELGNQTTDKNGRAIISVDFLPVYLQFAVKALFMGDPVYMGSNASSDEEEITINETF